MGTADSTLMSHPIPFYLVSDPYGEFSNFASFGIKLDGKSWPTTEHYFQAQKFSDKKDRDEIRKAKSPHLAAQMGRDRKRKLRKDWEALKLNAMRRALEAKFTQHDELRQLLLSTGTAKLVEHTANDAFWGDGGDGLGKNMLGLLLMELREKLRQSPS